MISVSDDWDEAGDLVAWILMEGPWIVGDWLDRAPSIEALALWLNRHDEVSARHAADLHEVSLRPRVEGVSWPHHRAVLKLDESTAGEVLERARVEGLTAAEVSRLAIAISRAVAKDKRTKETV